MAYRFCGIDERPIYDEPLTTEFNGVNLDHRFRGHFTTLNVTGRGLLSLNVTLTDKIGAAGAWLDSAELPSRSIEVEAQVEHDNLRALYNELNAVFLSKEPKRLTFSDEGEYYFNAIFEGIEEVKEDSNSQIITIRFMCPDPYKYKETDAISGVGVLEHKRKTLLPAAIRSITVDNVPDGDLIVSIDSTGKRLILRDFKAQETAGNRRIIFDLENGEVTCGRVNVLHKLNLMSDFENLLLPFGSKVRTNISGADLIIEFQERLL